MPLTAKQKKEVGERLLRGEDVELTLETDDMNSGEAGGATEGTHMGEDLHHPHPHGTLRRKGENMQQDRELDANIIIEKLQERLGQMAARYEMELAVKDAIILAMEDDVTDAADAVRQAESKNKKDK